MTPVLRTYSMRLSEDMSASRIPRRECLLGVFSWFCGHSTDLSALMSCLGPTADILAHVVSLIWSREFCPEILRNARIVNVEISIKSALYPSFCRWDIDVSLKNTIRRIFVKSEQRKRGKKCTIRWNIYAHDALISKFEVKIPIIRMGLTQLSDLHVFVGSACRGW